MLITGIGGGLILSSDPKYSQSFRSRYWPVLTPGGLVELTRSLTGKFDYFPHHLAVGPGLTAGLPVEPTMDRDDGRSLEV